MTVPSRTTLVVIEYKLVNGLETAQTTFHVHDTAAGKSSDDVASEVSLAVVTSILTAWNASQLITFHKNDTGPISVTASVLDSNGHVVARVERPVTGQVGSSAAIQLPLEVSAVITKHTWAAGTFVLGPRRRRGRMYMPSPTNAALQSSGRWITGYRDAVLAYMRSIFEAINLTNQGGVFPYQSVVLSQAGNGQVQPITRITCDDLPDTQRRRGDQLVVGAVSEVAIAQ